jgi:hypothetical protein
MPPCHLADPDVVGMLRTPLGWLNRVASSQP